MTVIEVQEHFRLLWQNEKPTLNLLFGTLRRGPQGTVPVSEGALARSGPHLA